MPDLASDLARRLRGLYTPAAIARAVSDGRPAVPPPPFGEAWMRRHLPGFVRNAPSRLHLDLAADLSGFHLTRGRRENRIAPRGGGKTVWSTTGYITYTALEGIEPYILILSESGPQAAGFLRDIKLEIEENPALAASYPAAAGRGPIWQADLIQLRNGVRIQSRGVGGKIRGVKNRADRPSLIVGDDLNGDDDAFSPTKRRHKMEWFSRAILNLGGPHTNVITLGTAIHRQAIVYELYRGETAAAWNSKSYRSVITWPDRMDLWGAWEGVLSNLTDPDRLAHARDFYERNRAAMDKGAEVLWPAREPLYDLMLHRVAVGRAAFDSDKQDRPGTDGATEWPAEWFDWPDRWFERWPKDLVLRLQTLDPSKGITDKPGDYQAHIWGGIDRNGTIYVDAEFRREPITECVARSLDIATLFKPSELRAEGNNTMGLLEPEFLRQAAARFKIGRPVAAEYVEVHHGDHKLRRLRHGGKHLGTRHPDFGLMVRIKNTPGGRMLVDQLRDVPNGEYDDGPDALATFMASLEELA